MSVGSAVLDLIHHRPDEMDADPANRALVDACLDIGFRRLRRIEGAGVIAQRQRQPIVVLDEIDFNRMFARVVITVADRIGEQLIQRQIDGVPVASPNFRSAQKISMMAAMRPISERSFWRVRCSAGRCSRVILRGPGAWWVRRNRLASKTTRQNQKAGA